MVYRIDSTYLNQASSQGPSLLLRRSRIFGESGVSVFVRLGVTCRVGHRSVEEIGDLVAMTNAPWARTLVAETFMETGNTAYKWSRVLAAVLQADPEELELALANKQMSALAAQLATFVTTKFQCRENRGLMNVTRRDVHPVSDWCVLANFVVQWSLRAD
ncbi:uncharacterized protein BDZ83DRAFT_725525 [Colletotrichum acutatum]|uniref:Uncharacterized protein n=1 Tax=Glomerella acutata TaxID=27357 RepID=A0AAD9D3R7_GLOAC|nr:uncharacterized protein BDZ83DRAFT_725525 [Colletotrichum acutatum]KAK1731980.1 hypothetical protein BDZ83DRAFT_725525 [Colletotrichum acutatum]